MNLIIRWVITAIALLVAVWVVPGIAVEGDALVAVGATAVVLGLANAVVRPLLRFLSCGLIVLTLGLFLLVINGLMLWLAAYVAEEWLGVGFRVDGFGPAFLGGLVVSVVSFALSILLPDGE